MRPAGKYLERGFSRGKRWPRGLMKTVVYGIGVFLIAPEGFEDFASTCLGKMYE